LRGSEPAIVEAVGHKWHTYGASFLNEMCYKLSLLMCVMWSQLYNIYIQCVPKKCPPFYFLNKISQFQQFLVYGILRKLATSWL